MIKVTVVCQGKSPTNPKCQSSGGVFPVPLGRNALYDMDAGRIKEGRQNEELDWVKRKENELYGVDGG